MYKLIALDIDGTLLNDGKEITPKTRDALIQAQIKGSRVILASGRPIAGLVGFAKELEMDKYGGLLLGYNGAKVVKMTTNETLVEFSIPNEIVVEFLRKLERFDVVPFIDDGKRMYVKDSDGFQVKYEYTTNSLEPLLVENIARALELDKLNPAKVLIAAPPEVLSPIIADITSGYEEQFSFILSAPFYLEMTMKGVNKADALKQTCEQLNISKEEVIAFGDAQNDCTMIEYAGKGVAMANSCEELLKLADETTLSNNDDGIAYSLMKNGVI